MRSNTLITCTNLQLEATTVSSTLQVARWLPNSIVTLKCTEQNNVPFSVLKHCACQRAKSNQTNIFLRLAINTLPIFFQNLKIGLECIAINMLI